MVVPASCSSVYLSHRKVMREILRAQVPDWGNESESCWDPSQPAHIGDTILSSLIEFGSVLHTSRGDDI